MSTELVSTRINSARFPDYIGKTVRLTAKAISFSGNTATVKACDGGEVTVILSPNSSIVDLYVEIIGTVSDPSTIKMLSCINLGSELDLELVNDTVELMHDPRFYNKIFT